jgi:NADH:ubiquinone oxidoreductase subunit 5 (subunit L)/multisubunit Na+/H+ antiporter MnhA subunit
MIMATSNLLNLIILLLLPLICIVIIVPMMFIFSKLFSRLISGCEHHEIKPTEFEHHEIKSTIPIMALVLLSAIVVAFFGIAIIKAEEAYVGGVHFHGGEAIYIGIVWIVWAILLCILATYLYVKKIRNHNKSNTADR